MIKDLAVRLFMLENKFPTGFSAHEAEVIMERFGLEAEFIAKATALESLLDAAHSRGVQDGVDLVRQTINIVHMQTTDERVNKGIELAMASVAIAIAACDNNFDSGEDIADSPLGDDFINAIEGINNVEAQG